MKWFSVLFLGFLFSLASLLIVKYNHCGSMVFINFFNCNPIGAGFPIEFAAYDHSLLLMGDRYFNGQGGQYFIPWRYGFGYHFYNWNWGLFFSNVFIWAIIILLLKKPFLLFMHAIPVLFKKKT